MTSYVTMEKSSNLSEPCFLQQGPACNTSGHRKRIQMEGGKMFQLPRELDLENKVIRMESD